MNAWCLLLCQCLFGPSLHTSSQPFSRLRAGFSTFQVGKLNGKTAIYRTSQVGEISGLNLKGDGYGVI